MKGPVLPLPQGGWGPGAGVEAVCSWALRFLVMQQGASGRVENEPSRESLGCRKIRPLPVLRLGTNHGLCTECEHMTLPGSPGARAFPGNHDPTGHPVDSGFIVPLA